MTSYGSFRARRTAQINKSLKYSQKTVNQCIEIILLAQFALSLGMMRYAVAILLILFACGRLDAQTLKGIVVDAGTGQPIPTVSVVNTVTQQFSYTNEDGVFTLPAKGGQQITLSFVGFTTKKLTMPPTLGTMTMRIEMERNSVQLEEIIVRPGKSKYQLDSAERRATYSRVLSRQKTTSPMSPVSFIADRISKKSKQIQNFQKSFNYWEGQRYIDTRYTPELVAKMTGLSEDSLAHFMNAYPMPYDYARTASELEIKMWIRYNFRQWMNQPNVIHITAADTLKKNR